LYFFPQLLFMLPILLFKLYAGPFIFPLQSQDYQYASYMPLLTDAVGQSLATRPDIIGTEISKVD
jgi:hypothetical protein